ncbi:MAG TPA: hypothetical protein VGC72_15590 [Candidatus Elarobacter sp.]
MQNTELRQTELRPLGAGELLDRAVTLFVRDFVPIVTVLAVVIVPIIVFQAIIAPKSGQVFADFGRVLTSAGDRTASAAATEALSRHSGSTGLSLLLVMIGIVARLVMWSAVVAVVATAYAGARISFGQAYRIGVQRWLPQIVVTLAFGAIAMVTAIPLLIAYVLVAVVIGLLAAVNQFVAAIIFGIIFGLLVLCTIAVVVSWVFMTYQLASVAVVTETANPVEAIGTALRRAFARGMRRRTIIGGLVVFIVSQVGSLPLLVVAATLTALTHVDVLYFAIVGVGTVLLEGIVAAFVVVYAVDIRVRREGFDIIAAEPSPVA